MYPYENRAANNGSPPTNPYYPSKGTTAATPYPLVEHGTDPDDAPGRGHNAHDDDDAASFNFDTPNTAPFSTIYNTHNANPRQHKKRRSTVSGQPFLYELDDIDNQNNQKNVPPRNANRTLVPNDPYSRYINSKHQEDLPPPPPPTKDPFDDNSAAAAAKNPFAYSSAAPYSHPKPPPPPEKGSGGGGGDAYPSLRRNFIGVENLEDDDYNDDHKGRGLGGRGSGDEAFATGKSSSEEDYTKGAEMERQRRLMLSRKPRFHFTKLPYFTILVTVIQVAVFIAELAKMAQLTGSAFQTKPYFNPMLGPSTYLLINMGARYAPCMHQISDITNDTTIQFPCPNSTTTASNVCSLPELCGLSSIPEANSAYLPHQWYRLITPIFLHAGFLHIIFNLLLQVTMGATIERQIGWLKFAIIYMASGVAGFLLGANFSPDGIASSGASGSLFGILAVNMLCFVYCGKKNTNMYGTNRYALFVAIMVAEVIVAFVLGLLPGMDNFSHIGGFAMGIALGITFLPDPCVVYEDSIIVYDGSASTMQQFADNWNPFSNWDHKIHERVYLWLSVRLVALGLACAYFGALIANFFNKGMAPVNNSCKWCKYFNCIPVNGWCDIGDVEVVTTSSGGPASSGAPATATPTATAASDASASPNASSDPSVVVVTSTKSSMPTQINNPNSPTGSNNGGFKREYAAVFEEQQPAAAAASNEYKTIAQPDSIIGHQNFGVGVGLYLIVGLITVRFMKSKKWI